MIRSLVEACLYALGAAGDELMPCPDGTMRTARDALAWQFDIARPLDRTLDLMAMSASDPGEAAAIRRLADGDDGAEPADADLAGSAGGVPFCQAPLVRFGEVAALVEATAVFDRLVNPGRARAGASVASAS